MLKLPMLLLALTPVLGLAAPARALTIDLGPGCGSCQGVTGSLSIVDEGGSFSVTLTLDSDGYTGDRTGFNQVGFGGISGWTSVSLVSSPLSTTTAWSAPVEANTSSNSLCTTGTSSDKVCTHGFASITGGGEHVWRFSVVGGTLETGEGAWHIGAQFANAAGAARGQILSESGTPIPEPSAALVFGLCAALVARTTRRTR